MKWRAIILTILFYASMAAITYPAILADLMGPKIRANNCRDALSISILLSLVPPVWLSTPFMTGFYEYGFIYNCNKKD